LCTASVCFREKSSRAQTAAETGETGQLQTHPYIGSQNIGLLSPEFIYR
jgi:hypothetical protein